MTVEDGRQAPLQRFWSGFGAEAEIEVHDTGAGDHVACSCTGVDVAYLPARLLEVLIAFVPFHGCKFGQCRSELVDGILRELGVGDVALHSFNSELRRHRAAPSVLDRVARPIDGRWLTNDTPVRAHAPGLQGFGYLDRAVYSWTFFIAGQHKSD